MEEFTLPHSHGEKDPRRIKKALAQAERFSATAEVFRQLSDTTRLQIFWLLCHQEACVINIAAYLDMSSPAVSHHLRSLQNSGLICSRRAGKEVYYKAADTQECELLHKAMEQVMAIACPVSAADHPGSSREIIYQIHGYLIQHLADRVTIEALAKQFLMNPTTLKKVFKEVYGTSLAAHMKQHRMEHAAQLLKETEMPIGQIALSVGYESQSRFTNAFRATYGLLPTAYRRQQKE